MEKEQMGEIEKPKKKRGRPTAADKFDKKAILDIAVLEFADHGFDGARLKVIAQKAGVHNSLMNYHFSNRVDLWQQAVLQLVEKLKSRFIEVQGYFKDLKGLAAAKAYTRQFIYFSAEHPAFYKIVFHEMCTKTERATWLVQKILTPLHHVLEKEAAYFQEKNGAEQGYATPNFASIVIGAANVFFIHAFQMESMYGINPFEKKEIEKHADIVIDILFAKFKE
jgi:AcrR family transcriptional regulator